MIYPVKKNEYVFFIFLIFLCFPLLVQAQCTGNDGSITICEKDNDPSNQTFNLFDHLNGSPQPGGTWTSVNPVIKNALSSDTGILNLWSINQFGTYEFTYSHPNCIETASVTVSLGGYPGEDNIAGGANACSDNSAVDLFIFLDNKLTSLTADINGTWSARDSSTAMFLNENFFNASAAGPGTYTLTYTVDTVDTCAERSADVILEVHRTPNPGLPTNIIICTTEDFSSYREVDLLDYLSGEDSNGIWEDVNQVGQITSLDDSIINIEKIFNSFGSGEYVFEYTVFPTHGNCAEGKSSVVVQIPDISANFDVKNQCLNESLNFEIQHQRPGSIFITYNLEYEILDSDNSVVFSNIINNIEMADSKGFTINHEVSLPNNTLAPGNYTIRTKEITNIIGISCDTLTATEDVFTIFHPNIEIPDTCYMSNIIEAKITNLTNNNGILSNDTLLVNYTITDMTTSQESVVSNQSINFNNGEGILDLDMSSFSKTSNNYKIEFTAAPENGTGCINQNFIVRRVPDDILLNINIDNSCDASDIRISIDAPPLSNGNYRISYSIRNLTTNQIVVDYADDITGGLPEFNLNLGHLEDGSYEIILQSTQNDVTPCREKTEFETRKNFSIGGNPEKPVLDVNQSFCLPDYTPDLPTIADLVVTQGTNLEWYESEISDVPLDIEKKLEDGVTYYVSSKNTDNNCRSSERSKVTVSLIDPQEVTSGNTRPIFCDKDIPTIADLEVISVNPENVVWYDSIQGGNELADTTVLVNETSYFAVGNINGCENTNRLEVTPTVLTPPTPNYTGETALCALDNITLMDIENNITSNTDHELIWYASPDEETTLDNSVLIKENITYNVANVNITYDCESTRIPLTFSLENCSAEEHYFFIPDGFSPNNDGVNENYFIPNINYFYPNYTFEIYNRYGQILFQGSKSSPKWDGKNSTTQQNATSGVYYYILRYNKDNKPEKQGKIYLSK
ncbi:MAG TPA: hypothetical protein DDY16_06655 [Tenacibaculum sp.]|nr:hypothetical protein [Tenacibaculum sp.]